MSRVYPDETHLYYEAHVTVEPVFDERLDQFRLITAEHNFRVADLLFKKREQDTEERSSKDSFCTSRSKSLSVITDNTINVVNELREAGFDVWRYKIEDTVLDSRHEDVFEILGELCEHDWVCADNKYVSGAEACTKCKRIRAAVIE